MAQSGSVLIFFPLFAAVAIISLHPAQSQTSIGFEKANYMFDEEHGFCSVHLIKRSNDASQQRFSIAVQVLPESAQLGEPPDGDLVYSLPGSGGVVHMGPSEDRISITIFVFDDTKPEYNESILLTSSVPPGSPSSECSQYDGCFQSTRITIVDNDELVVGFENTSLEVSESVGEVKLCVKISQPSTASIEIRLFNLTVETHHGSANLSDFVSGNLTLEGFGDHKRQQCFSVTVVNDSIPENDEVFTVTLEKPSTESPSHIRILPEIVTITVLDDDGILDGEDTLIYSLGLGSTGYDHSIITEPIPQGIISPPTPPSYTTRRRRQTVEHRCPDRGTDGFICHSLGKRAVRKKLLPPYSYHTRHPRQAIPVNRICQRRSILFVLDTSGSMGRESFTRMTTAVSSLVTSFCVPTQFAVMTFGDLLRLEFCFNCFDNSQNGRAAAGQAIKNTMYRPGPWTRTGEAARCVCNELLDRFKCGLWVDSCIDVVFITNGRSNGALDVCREVQCLHNHQSRHINTYAIGIGNYNETEIKCLSHYSNTEEVVFGFEDFNQFVGYLNNVTARLLLPVNLARYSCINRDRRLDP